MCWVKFYIFDAKVKMKYLYLAIFCIFFWSLIKRDRIYVIPCLLLVYANLNGLLSWEDFALKGVIKFQDYGLIFCMAIMFMASTLRKNNGCDVQLYYCEWKRLMPLHLYYLFLVVLFLYSIISQPGIEWPVKMGRTFFYGIIYIVILNYCYENPQESFSKLFKSLMIITIIYGGLYIIYNVTSLPIYAVEAYESLDVIDVGEVKRNFAGFPIFGIYFLIYITYALVNNKVSPVWGGAIMSMLMLCVAFTLTRGWIISMVIVQVLAILYIGDYIKFFRRLICILIFTPGILIAFSMFDVPQFMALLSRFEEFSESGLFASSNSVVRMIEFDNILKNVIDFNPLFGFGFTNVSLLGYQSSQIHGGSADNGFSHIVGIGGLFGVVAFSMLFICWVTTNLKLQHLQSEWISKVNFIYIIFLPFSMVNGSSYTYVHAFVIPLMYDFLTYSYLLRKQYAN